MHHPSEYIKTRPFKGLTSDASILLYHAVIRTLNAVCIVSTLIVIALIVLFIVRPETQTLTPLIIGSGISALFTGVSFYIVRVRHQKLQMEINKLTQLYQHRDGYYAFGYDCIDLDTSTPEILTVNTRYYTQVNTKKIADDKKTDPIVINAYFNDTTPSEHAIIKRVSEAITMKLRENNLKQSAGEYPEISGLQMVTNQRTYYNQSKNRIQSGEDIE